MNPKVCILLHIPLPPPCYMQLNMFFGKLNTHHLWLKIRVKEKISIWINSKYVSIGSKLLRKLKKERQSSDALVCAVHHKYKGGQM